MKYNIILSGRFKKELKSLKRRGYDLSLLNKVIQKLEYGEPLERKYQDHKFRRKI